MCTMYRCDGMDLEKHLPLDVEVKFAGPECPVTIVAQEDGCYACTYQAKAPGFHRLEVTSCGKPVGCSPFSVKVKRGFTLSRCPTSCMWCNTRAQKLLQALH